MGREALPRPRQTALRHAREAKRGAQLHSVESALLASEEPGAPSAGDMIRAAPELATVAEMPGLRSDIKDVFKLVKRVGDLRSSVMPFLNKVTKTQSFKQLFPDVELIGGTLKYPDDTHRHNEMAMFFESEGAPSGLKSPADFSLHAGKLVKTDAADQERARTVAELHSRGGGLPITAGGAMGNLMGSNLIRSSNRASRMSAAQMRIDRRLAEDPNYEENNRIYIQYLQDHNPAFLEKLVAEQGEIARTQPFRPGSPHFRPTGITPLRQGEDDYYTNLIQQDVDAHMESIYRELVDDVAEGRYTEERLTEILSNTDLNQGEGNAELAADIYREAQFRLSDVRWAEDWIRNTEGASFDELARSIELLSDDRLAVLQISGPRSDVLRAASEEQDRRRLGETLARQDIARVDAQDVERSLEDNRDIREGLIEAVQGSTYEPGMAQRALRHPRSVEEMVSVRDQLMYIRDNPSVGYPTAEVGEAFGATSRAIQEIDIALDRRRKILDEAKDAAGFHVEEGEASSRETMQAIAAFSRSRQNVLDTLHDASVPYRDIEDMLAVYIEEYAAATRRSVDDVREWHDELVDGGMMSIPQSLHRARVSYEEGSISARAYRSVIENAREAGVISDSEAASWSVSNQ